ncbi:MAG TPA: adenosylmethionine decarboxylase [Acholeplasmataceae bacterium]|jgi:S-adenosylmethionine decarboxylase|nr:adenosylmethionine decarboxylase [Acholeplasmataceae bacterium]
MKNKIKLYGFNNLTKTLSFNIYDICYTRDDSERLAYVEYIDQEYNSERLTKILEEVAKIINAKILNVASQDYEPQGASVTIMIAEEEIRKGEKCDLVTHLNKSHLTVHTYPETHPDNNVSTFRVDIDVSTCGEISPLKALNTLIESFDSDIIIMDYRIRGFTRDLGGMKHYLDHNINSIQDFINKEILDNYTTYDVNLAHTNIFHTKMMLNKFILDNYLFKIDAETLSENEKEFIKQEINQEMVEIYYGMNIPKMK